MSCGGSHNGGGGCNNNGGSNNQRPQTLPIPPSLRPSQFLLDDYPTPVHAALAIINGTARIRGENDGQDDGDANGTRRNEGGNGRDLNGPSRNEDGNPPNPRPQQ